MIKFQTLVKVLTVSVFGWGVVPLIAPADAVFGEAPAAEYTERVSVDTDENQVFIDSSSGVISADGRFVAFISNSADLVPDDTNNSTDVFVRDLVLGTTERVSIGDDEEQANSTSLNPAISANGRFVAFQSSATNLIPGDPSSGAYIFVRDRTDGTTERIGKIDFHTAAWGPAISADGRYVARSQGGSVYLFDRLLKTSELISVDSDGNPGTGGTSADPAISADGRFVAFFSFAPNLVPDDTNGVIDIFVRDRLNGSTERVSIDSDENQWGGSTSDPDISPDGRFVVFSSNFGVRNSPIFLRDRTEGTTEIVSIRFDGSIEVRFNGNPVVSADGRYVAFQSGSVNLSRIIYETA